jgi:predicted transposase YbfD/YdcC
LLTNVQDWIIINSLVEIESQRCIKSTDETQKETRYYISSLDKDTKTIGQIRSQWGIENKLHWQIDVSFGEDKSRKRDRNAAENYSIVLRMALNLVKSENTTKRSIKGKRLKVGWDDGYLLCLLKF